VEGVVVGVVVVLMVGSSFVVERIVVECSVEFGVDLCCMVSCGDVGGVAGWVLSIVVDWGRYGIGWGIDGVVLVVCAILVTLEGIDVGFVEIWGWCRLQS
jgi:hypothetical protein